MKKSLKVFLAGVGAILLFALVLGLILPSEWNAEARVTVDAAPARIHSMVGSLANWEKWATSAMTRHDPSAVVTISADGGSMSWTGDKLGTGRMTITENDPTTGIKYEGAYNSDDVSVWGGISYEHTQDGTLVVWREAGDLPPIIGPYLAGMTGQATSDSLAGNLGRLKALVEETE
ncbi:MAG: SRPBCC family protein [Planctomycetes bacterium]|nr:SRPBCC family protein [Planctomycetota bacterium]